MNHWATLQKVGIRIAWPRFSSLVLPPFLVHPQFSHSSWFHLACKHFKVHSIEISEFDWPNPNIITPILAEIVIQATSVNGKILKDIFHTTCQICLISTFLSNFSRFTVIYSFLDISFYAMLQLLYNQHIEYNFISATNLM